MVDFVRLAQGKANTKQFASLVDNSNVIGNNNLFNNFDQKFSQIGFGGFESNLRSDNDLAKRTNPENYINFMNQKEISGLNLEIENCVNYMHQNTQYIAYQNQIKKILKENECDDIGDLLARHGDSNEVLSAMANLQKAFDSDPMMKSHYNKSVAKLNDVNEKINDLRDHAQRGTESSKAAINAIAVNEYHGDVNAAKNAYTADMQEVATMRNNAISHMQDSLIPFVDETGHMVDKFKQELKQDQTLHAEGLKIDLNLANSQLKNAVNSEQVPLAQPLNHENDNSGPSL